MQTFYQSFGRTVDGSLYHQETITDERLVPSWINDPSVKLVLELRLARNGNSGRIVRTIKNIE